MEPFRFVTGEPALLVEDSLVVAELHIGYETRLYKQGVYVQSGTGDMLSELKNLVRETGAEEVIVIGDLKQSLAPSRQEREEVPRFLRRLQEEADVHVIPGNHDGKLEGLLPGDVELHPDGLRRGDVYLIHGHSWPPEEVCDCRALVMAHIHPAVEFRDDLGFRSVEHCWLRGPAHGEPFADRYDREAEKIELEEVVVVPPFNNLIGGMPVNREDDEEEREISPITRNGVLDVEEAEVYLLDGTALGTVSNLESTGDTKD